MNGNREEVLAAGRAAVARLQVAFDAGIEAVVQQVQEETGERLLVRAPSVLDAGWHQLWRMSWQASNFEAAVRLLEPLMRNSDRPLGTVLKTADAALVQAVTRHLVQAGVLPSAEEVPR